MRRALTLLALCPMLMGFTVPADQAKDVKRVEQYLSSLTTIVADFNQVDANGGTSHGTFTLKRPGKMRWDYAPPTPILLVSNGRVITYYDSELGQVNHIAFDDTLAAFLAQPVITLNSGSARLTAFSAKEGVVRATVVLAKKPDEGSLTLEFADNPLVIKQMVVTDATGGRTQIQLQNAKFGVDVPESTFFFKDPRGNNRNLRN